jgi:hypothetical protein
MFPANRSAKKEGNHSDCPVAIVLIVLCVVAGVKESRGEPVRLVLQLEFFLPPGG